MPKSKSSSHSGRRASARTAGRPAGGKAPLRKSAADRYWSGEVTRTSNALDLEPGVFKLKEPRQVAASLKRSALSSKRRKTGPMQSAMSMLNLYINRAGRNLPPERKRVLEQAKDELRKQFRQAA